jgi:hypothetical protein
MLMSASRFSNARLTIVELMTTSLLPEPVFTNTVTASPLSSSFEDDVTIFETMFKYFLLADKCPVSTAKVAQNRAVCNPLYYRMVAGHQGINPAAVCFQGCAPR